MPATIQSIELVLGQVLSVALGIVGAIFVLMVVISGFQLISAGADKEGAAKAKNTLTFAVMGLILAASAFMIVTIFGNFLGLNNVGIFRICLPGGCPT